MIHLELHCHTGYSRGRKVPFEAFMSPEELIQTAKQKGLSAVAITDHDTCEAWPRAAKEARRLGLLFIPACEVSSSAGHIIGLGLSEPVPRGLSAEETLSRIRQQGALAIAPHPCDLQGVGLRHRAAQADAVEIFNALAVDRFSNARNRRFAARHRLPQVVGSDAHIPEALGLAVNHLQADSLDECLREIKAGRVTHTARYQSRSQLVRWAHLRLSQSQPAVEQYISANYNPLKKPVANFFLHKFVSTPHAKKWQALASFGVGCATAYSFAKNARCLF